ncbi:GIY-YIG nuclease family protein [Bradyrhizobium sp. STM 3562]|uniref:GIY-YIG nuclease family protein n=1 Tax=Bradyrhizobium sp. STM 3562 TaxID=578924 RepID=UPI00389117BD
MKYEERKAAVRAYKERKPAVGIYVVRCAATGQCWVGRALNLATIQTRLWFMLRQGSSPHRSLQAAWHEHGAEAFSFAAVETFEEDESLSYARDRALKERLAYWEKELDAEAV